MSLATCVHDIKTLVRSFHPILVIETVEEERLLRLARTVADQVLVMLFEWSVTQGLVKTGLGERLPVPNTGDLAKALQHIAGLTIKGLYVLKDVGPHFDDPRTIRQMRDLAQAFRTRNSTLVLTGVAISLPPELEREAVRYALELPTREELRTTMCSVLESLKKDGTSSPVPSPEDEPRILDALQGMTLHQARQAVAHVVLAEGRLSSATMTRLLDRKAQIIREGGILEYYPVTDNRFQLGGFARLRAWLARARVGFTPEAKALNLTAPRGILIVGVPGCGKSLAAKVIAREWSLPLLKLDAGRLFDKYIGESEKNFRRGVALAESMAPVVFWIDEIEKGIVAGGSSEADAGLSRRLFGAFLTWMQEKRQDVFVVATANDLSGLPPELLRKGRFDEVFFVDLPTPPEREAILHIHLGLRRQDPQKLDLSRIVAACDGFSGAEIEQTVVGGLYRALHDKKPLDTTLLLDEIAQTIPLSASRREDLASLRDLARDRFVPVG